MRETGFSTFTVEDKWHHHAYTYGFRRVLMGRFDKTSPIDPNGEWFAEDLADAAEDFYRLRFKSVAK